MIRNVLSTVAAAGLVMTPIAAQAGTRASDAGVSIPKTSFTSIAPRKGAEAGDSEGVFGFAFLPALIAIGAVVTTVVVVATDTNEEVEDASPGANN